MILQDGIKYITCEQQLYIYHNHNTIDEMYIEEFKYKEDTDFWW